MPIAARPKIQLKTLNKNERALALIAAHPTIIFCARDPNGSLTQTSKAALALINYYQVSAKEIYIERGGEIELALQEFSGWQYFPQLYVHGEFIGGTLVMSEFFESGEYTRITGNSISPHRASLNANRASSVWKLSLSKDEARLLVGRADGTIELLETRDRSSRFRIKSHNGWVNTVRFSHCGSYFYSGGSDTVLRRWDQERTSPTCAALRHTRWINDIAVDPQGQFIASVGGDRVIHIWDPSSLTSVLELRVHQANIWTAVACNGALVTGDEDGMLAIHDTTIEFAPRASVRAHRNGITSMSIGLGSAIVCTASFDGTVSGWDLDGRVAYRCEGFSERVWSVYPIADRGLIAVGCADRSVHICEPQSGKHVHRLMCASHPIALRYIVSSKSLAIGLSDGSVLWNRI
jgi:WD40 repeat protein